MRRGRMLTLPCGLTYCPICPPPSLADARNVVVLPPCDDDDSGPSAFIGTRHTSSMLDSDVDAYGSWGHTVRMWEDERFYERETVTVGS